MSLFSIGRSILNSSNIDYKLKYTKYVLNIWKSNQFDKNYSIVDKDNKEAEILNLNNTFKLPELPIFPNLVYNDYLPTYNQLNVSQEIYILHMLAHIEFSAINIYWDTLIRPFDKLVDREIIDNIIKDEYERNSLEYNLKIEEVDNILNNLKVYYNSHFLSILNDEIHHFEILNNRLIQLGSFYGKLPVTNKLLTHCIETKSDFLSRVIMTNLVSEAKGLDAGPKLSNKLFSMNCKISSEIVKEISNDEEKHVAVGMFILNDIALKLKINPGTSVFEYILNF